MATRQSLNFSASQESVVGKWLYRLYYNSGELAKLRDLLPGTTGYPHNGGVHSLTLTGTREDLIAWVELFEDYTGLELGKLKYTLRATTQRVYGTKAMPELFHHLTEVERRELSARMVPLAAPAAL